jgi:hypothetical protein
VSGQAYLLFYVNLSSIPSTLLQKPEREFGRKAKLRKPAKDACHE